MRNDTRKKPNAYKHGIYSQKTTVPGEIADEFEKLHSALIQEWMPAGPTEKDAVLGIAKAMCHKRRMQKFRNIQLLKNCFDSSHPSFDEESGIKIFLNFLRLQPDDAIKYAHRCLRPNKAQYLKNKFPLSNFKSSREWADAVTNEIKSVLMPVSLPDDHPFAVLGEMFDSLAAFDEDSFDKELKLDERLDLMIDRAVKRLVQTKAMKQMLGLTGAERVEDRVRKIAVKRAANG
jgi:hypothetical protein